MHALPFFQELGYALEQFWRDDTRKLAFIGRVFFTKPINHNSENRTTGLST